MSPGEWYTTKTKGEAADPRLNQPTSDGNDEVIYPLDHKTAGFIVDDDM